MNPFEFFGLKPQIFVDQVALDKAYQRTQLRTHPDQYQDDYLKEAALKLSEEATHHYIRLKNPIDCLHIMLEEFGGLKTNNDPNFLGEIFKLQEQFLDNPETLQKKIKILTQEIEVAFQGKDTQNLQYLSNLFIYIYKK